MEVKGIVRWADEARVIVEHIGTMISTGWFEHGIGAQEKSSTPRKICSWLSAAAELYTCIKCALSDIN